jgi:hypothetical protein
MILARWEPENTVLGSFSAGFEMGLHIMAS